MHSAHEILICGDNLRKARRGSRPRVGVGPANSVQVEQNISDVPVPADILSLLTCDKSEPRSIWEGGPKPINKKVDAVLTLGPAAAAAVHKCSLALWFDGNGNKNGTKFYPINLLMILLHSRVWYWRNSPHRRCTSVKQNAGDFRWKCRHYKRVLKLQLNGQCIALLGYVKSLHSIQNRNICLACRQA